MHSHDTDDWTHEHSFGQEQVQAGERKTIAVILITAIMMVVEIAAGLAFGSMALLADGLHMASHTVAIGIAAFAYIYARRHAFDPRFNFGTGKVNALAGFGSAVLLVIFVLFMAWESVLRFVNPVDIAFNQAIVVAVIGLAVNGVSAVILSQSPGHDHGHGHAHDHEHEHDHDHHHHDHNLRAAYIHVIADALTSLLAIFALLAGKYFGLNWLDPVMASSAPSWSGAGPTACCATRHRCCSITRPPRRFAGALSRPSKPATSPASPTCTSGPSARPAGRRRSPWSATRRNSPTTIATCCPATSASSM